MCEKEFISAVDSMSEIDKLSVYMDYFVQVGSLRHCFEVRDLYGHHLECQKRRPLYEWSEPEKKFGGIGMWFLWKDIHIKSFKEFISSNNIELVNIGPKWREQGFASESWITLHGIYDWVYKNRKFLKQ